MSYNIDNIIFIAFLVANIALGLFSSRGVKTIKEYAIGNRNFSTATIAATVVATWIGGSFFFTISAEAYKNGLNFIWVVLLGDFSCLLLVGLFFIPRMSEFLGKLSIAEVMGDLYGQKVRIVTAAAGFLGTCGIIAMQLRVAGLSFEYSFGIPSIYGILIAGFIVTLYSSLGGIKSVTFTDIIQFITFGTVIPAIGYFLLSNLDSSSRGIDFLLNNPLFDYKKVFDFSQKQPLYHLFLFFCFAIPAFNPAIFQRISMAKNTTQASKSFVISAFACLFLVIAISSIGVLTLINNPNINPTEIVKHIILNPCFIVGFKGCILSGIMAMVMSTIDSYINCTSVLIVHDFCKPLKIKFITNQLLFARVVSLLIGVFSVLLSLRSSSLLDLALSAYASYMPIVTVPFIIAILGFRTTEKSVLLGMSAGVITVLIWNILEIKAVDSTPPAMLFNLIVLISSNYLLKQEGRWVEVKVNSSFTKYKKVNVLKNLLNFNFTNILKQNTPKGEGLISMIGLFIMISSFFSISKLPKEHQTNYSYLLDILYPLSLLGSTALISYPLWLQKWRNSYCLAVTWNIIMFTVLICFGFLMLLISNFSEIQLMIFMVNFIIISVFVRWKWALFYLILGTSLTIFCYKNYIAFPVIDNTLTSSEFKVVALLLLISSSLVLFLKPKQEMEELTEHKADHLGEQIHNRDEELEKLIEVKNEFLRNLEHEAHAPIVGITSMGQILFESYDKLTDNQKRKGLEEIAKSSERLSSLVNNMIDLSKLLSLNYTLDTKEVDLSKLVYDRLNYCKKLYLNGKELEFFTKIEDNIKVNCDEHYIKSTLDNLIINAIQYSKEGNITLELYENADSTAIDFSIQDEGVAIPQAELYDVFGAFIVSSKTKTPAGGRGIGLALCEKAIKAHGGKIWAKSDGVKGATFIFTLPA